MQNRQAEAWMSQAVVHSKDIVEETGGRAGPQYMNAQYILLVVGFAYKSVL
jgi:hypothetical protein